MASCDTKYPCGDRAELPSLIPHPSFLILWASLHVVFLQEHHSFQSSFWPTATYFVSSFLVLYFHISPCYVCRQVDAIPPERSISGLLLVMSSIKRCWAAASSLGTSWLGALFAPTCGGDLRGQQGQGQAPGSGLWWLLHQQVTSVCALMCFLGRNTETDVCLGASGAERQLPPRLRKPDGSPTSVARLRYSDNVDGTRMKMWFLMLCVYF